MSTQLTFPDIAALEAALTTVLPSPIAAGPAHISHQGEMVLIAIEAVLDAKTARNLAAAGVAVDTAGAPAAEGRSLACLAEAVPARRTANLESGTVLFALPGAADQAHAGMLDLITEMLRLGCTRQELRVLAGPDGGLVLLRAVDPPYYTLLRARDRDRGLRAFAAGSRDRDGVWIEIGWEHGLSDRLVPPANDLLLIPGGDEPWWRLPDGEWCELFAAADLAVPEAPVDLAPQALTVRWHVPLRLASGLQASRPALWVLRHNAVARLEERLAALAPGAIDFAATGGEQPMIVLRARPAARGSLRIDLAEPYLDAEPYTPLDTDEMVWLPPGKSIEPPIGREQLRAVLAREGWITWLVPVGENGAFRAERLPEEAFVPLADWVDYVIERDAEQLAAWRRAAVFDFPPIELLAAPPDEARAGVAPTRRQRGTARRPGRPPSGNGPLAEPGLRQPRAVPAAAPAPAANREPSAEELRLAAAERRFVESPAPLDDPGRREQWIEIAEAAGATGRSDDAGRAWAQALWEGADGGNLASRWAARGLEIIGAASAADVLASDEMKEPEVWALASQMIAGVPEVVSAEQRVKRLLDRHDEVLDLRTLYLVRRALAELTRDDLGLAEIRDRVLRRLADGLSLDRDVASVLRFGRDADAVRRLIGLLEALPGRAERPDRKRSLVEAPTPLTGAYVRLTVAWGLARLGAASSRRFEDEAIAALDLSDPVHGTLTAAYRARIAQARRGGDLAEPLPEEVMRKLTALDASAAYVVDQVRKGSAILAAGERIDPYGAWLRRRTGLGALGGALTADGGAAALDAELRGLEDAGETVGRTQRLAAAATALLRLPAMELLPRLDRIVGLAESLPPADRAEPLLRALVAAGHVDDAGRMATIGEQLDPLLREMPAAVVPGLLARVLHELRRVDLETLARQLVTSADERLASEAAPLPARLVLAAAFADLGQLDRAEPILAAAERERLATRSTAVVASSRRGDLLRAYAVAAGHLPLDRAIGILDRIAGELSTATDSLSLNRYLCLAVVHLIESLVLGYASDVLAVAAQGRRRLELDERQVRRRIHRDRESERGQHVEKRSS